MGRAYHFALGLIFCTATALMLAGDMRAQDAPDASSPSTQQFGGPHDWSNRHVIYTRNGSAEDMLRVRNDPRFLNSTLLRYMREHPDQTEQAAPTRWSQNGQNDTIGIDPQELPFGVRNPIQNPVISAPFRRRPKVDWSLSLGPNAGLAFGESPSIYTYNYTTPSCSSLSAAPPVVGDFAVYTINATPVVGSQANLVGVTNLYTTGDGSGFCPGTGPSILFSYAIGSGGSQLSPVISLDGSKVAWIENRTATTSYLHVTKWVANQGTTSVWPAAVTGAFVNGACTPVGSSCDFVVQYTASTYPGCPTAFSAGNGHSELYVDYSGNTAFISANNGLLYHIKNIFSNTASPTVDFCIPVNATFETTPKPAMSGPVYDTLLNKVYITDSETIYGFTVNANTSTPSFIPAGSYTFGNAGSNFNYPTGPGPLLDMFNNFIYVFSTFDANSNTSVTQIPTSLAAGSGVAVTLGPKSTNSNQILFYGAFDKNYFNNGPTDAAATLYTCGTDPTTTTAQDLYSIKFNATGVINTTPAMSANKNVNPGGAAGVCSPITEFYDGTNDRIFVGMGQPGAAGADVVTMWNVNTRLTNATATPTATTPASYRGGTSGISADNSASGTAQAESIYFSTERTGLASTAVARNGFNVHAIYSDGTTFSQTGGMDGDGNAYSSNLLGATLSWNGTTFTFGTTNNLNGWANTTITLPSGQFSTLTILAAAVNSQTGTGPQTFTVTYTDATTTTLSQTISDWFVPLGFSNESVAKTMAYRNMYNGQKDNRNFDIFGYTFAINPNKTVQSLTLPPTANVVVLAAALATNCGGQNFCAVKLTQSALK